MTTTKGRSTRGRTGKKTPDVLSGWEVEPRERKDFYHRVRTFPPDVAAWRKQLVEQLVAGEDVPFLEPPPGETAVQLRARLDDGTSHLREVARILAALHGTPDLGNKKDPVDELVYIILSRKTREDAYQGAFTALKEAFPSWDDLLEAPESRIRRLVRSSGLEDKKTTSLRGALSRIREEFGSCSMEPARRWSDERLEKFLCSLPEIQRKSAYCIMMYAFGRDVFPVDTHVGRVLSRIGIHGELGLRLQGLGHRQLQAVLADLIPPPLRYGLHVNLVVHGREICRARNPRCSECELRNFCSHHRAQELARVEQENSLSVIDLFCGAGGISEGFERGGYRVLAAVDSDPMAMRTYRLNHPSVPDEGVICGDLTEFEKGRLKKVTRKKKIDVLISAPPCQGFSSAGFRSKQEKTSYKAQDDDRNNLFECMIAAALELKPRLVLMENVPGMGSTRREDTSFLDEAARQLEEVGGYTTDTWKLNAAAFGVPQDRTRLFLVASRSGGLPARPEQEYQNLRGRNIDIDALPPVTLDEAIFDLPDREADSSAVVEQWERAEEPRNQRFRRYLKKFNLVTESRLIYNHAVRYHNDQDLELYALLEPGEDSVHAVERHGRKDLMRYRQDVFDDKYAKLRGDRPCRTIVAHLAKDGNSYIHPTQVRSISVREAARVQSFHDRYAFCGAPTDQWKQIGNAVPPVLAQAIARSFRRFLERA